MVYNISLSIQVQPISTIPIWGDLQLQAQFLDRTRSIGRKIVLIPMPEAMANLQYP